MTLLDQPVTGKLADQIRKIEDGAQPVELLANQAGVFAEAKYGLDTERCLVGLLGSVAHPHQWKQKQIDLETQFPKIGVGVFGRIFDDALDDVVGLVVNIQLIGLLDYGLGSHFQVGVIGPERGRHHDMLRELPPKAEGEVLFVIRLCTLPKIPY